MQNELYILVNDQETGPFSLQDLNRMVENGEIAPDTLYASPGMSGWEPLSNVVAARPAECPPSMASPTDAQDSTPLKSDARLLSYDGAACRSLMEDYRGLCGYRAAMEWEQRAREEVKLVEAAIHVVDDAIAAESVTLDRAKREFQQQSFLKKAFGGHEREAVMTAQISSLNARKLKLLVMSAELETALLVVPKTGAEKDLFVKKLRHRKKELQAEKRSETTAMAGIRQEARVQSVDAGKTWLGLYDSELGADQRRAIRCAKESALAPHEEAAAFIERQIMDIENTLIWLDRFG